MKKAWANEIVGSRSVVSNLRILFIRSGAMKSLDAHRRRRKKQRMTTTTAVGQLVVRDITAASVATAETASPRPAQAPLDWAPVHPSSMNVRTLISQDIWSAQMSMMRIRDPPSSWLLLRVVFGARSPLSPSILQKDTSPHGKVTKKQRRAARKLTRSIMEIHELIWIFGTTLYNRTLCQLDLRDATLGCPAHTGGDTERHFRPVRRHYPPGAAGSRRPQLCHHGGQPCRCWVRPVSPGTDPNQVTGYFIGVKKKKKNRQIAILV